MSGWANKGYSVEEENRPEFSAEDVLPECPELQECRDDAARSPADLAAEAQLKRGPKFRRWIGGS